MAKDPAKPAEPSADDVYKWLQGRFWYFALGIAAFNIIMAALGWPLLNYVLKEYVDTSIQAALKDYQPTIDQARQQAFAARQDSESALKEATAARTFVQSRQVDAKNLNVKLTELSTTLDSYKQDAKEKLPALKSEIAAAQRALGDYQKLAKDVAEVRRNQFAWRATEVPYTRRDETKTFEVDFAPNVPDPDKVKVVIGGIFLERPEHDVSVFRAQVQNVKVDGTKVTGEYRCTLSDTDMNGPSGGSLTLSVFAQFTAAR